MEQHEQTIIRQTTAQLLLRGVSGVTFGKSYPLLGNMLIGREPSCDITIPSDEISRDHARIITRPGSVLLEDMGSSNGTFVNGQPIQKAIVKQGDEIRFDKIRFKVLSLSEADEFLTEPDYNADKKTHQQPAQQEPRSSNSVVIIFVTLIAAIAAAAAYYIY